ncbi:protein of unknown function [Lachnospiraceae bacterium C7]|nr:protein of unknown function [Lachnospiraceae bacterium C7]
MAEPNTIYKLTILSMLDKIDFPLSNSQIANFFLDADYTSYFNVQEIIQDLVGAGLILSNHTHSNTLYSLTESGSETLEFFRDKISDAIENDILKYFEKNQLELKQNNSVRANYYKTDNQKYAAHLQVFSKDQAVIDVTLVVQTQAQANAICTNWKDKNTDVYEFLMDNLLQ